MDIGKELNRIVPRIDAGGPNPLDEQLHHCEFTLYRERERIHSEFNLLLKNNDEQITTLWLGAFRYYLGRMTYAVGDFCDLLIAEWPSLPDRTKNLIQRDLTEAFARDDEQRADGKEYLQLGHDCDRQQWERVRKLWDAQA